MTNDTQSRNRFSVRYPERYTQQEKAAYRTGYLDGRKDTAAMLSAMLYYTHAHPDFDPDTTEGQALLLEIADKALQTAL